VVASSAAVLILGFLENQPSGRSSVVNGLLLDLLGVPLAPGWFLTRGMFERLAGNQFLGWAFVIPFVSAVIDTGIIFGVWQLFRRVNGITNRPLSS
jgi:hypothetical protein